MRGFSFAKLSIRIALSGLLRFLRCLLSNRLFEVGRAQVRLARGPA